MCRWLAQLLINTGQSHSDPLMQSITDPTALHPERPQIQ